MPTFFRRGTSLPRPSGRTWITRHVHAVAIRRLSALLASVAIALSACAFFGPSDAERLAEALEAQYGDLIARIELNEGSFLDRPEVAAYVMPGIDRDRLHGLACDDVPRLSVELGLTGNVGVGFYSDDGNLLDGGSSTGCTNP